jgi:NDP-sugar pyrophosphorylase family protein
VSALDGWPALVLAAGLGTRLRPLSDVRAKAALPVAGRPLIARILELLHTSGIRRVVVNLHHLPESITRIVGDGSSFGLDVRYSWEPQVLGSGGGPARAIPLLAADRFLVVNGDTLADVDIEALAAAHRASGALVTMAVTPADLSRYNAVVADPSGAVVGFAPRTGEPALAAPSHPAPEQAPRHSGTPAPGTPAPRHPGTPAPRIPYHFIGIQAVNAAAFTGVLPDRPSETVRDLYPRLLASRPGCVRVFSGDHTIRFHDIGTPAGYLATVQRIAAAEHRPLDRGQQCDIDSTSRVDGSVLWDRVRVGAGAHVVDCIVADDVTIPPGARYHRQAITTSATEPIDQRR